MKPIVLAACLSALSLASAAQAADPAVESVIRQFNTAFNKGDVAGAKALHVAAPVIIDEFAAPYIWTGPQAFDGWIAGLAKSEAAQGKTDGQVAIGAPTREEVSNGRAYVIAPSTYTYRRKGVTYREVAQITFVMAKEASGWKVAAWTWTGAQGKPVK